MAPANYLTNAIRAFITGASAKPPPNPIREAYANFIARLAGRPPRPAPLDPHAVDLEDRLEYLRKGIHRVIGLSDRDPDRQRGERLRRT